MMSPSFKDFRGMAKDGWAIVTDMGDKISARIDGAQASLWHEKLEYATEQAVHCFDVGLHPIAQEYYHMILEIACQAEGAHDAHVDRVHRLLTHIESKTPEEDRIEISRDGIVDVLSLKGEDSRRLALTMFIAETFPHIINPSQEPTGASG